MKGTNVVALVPFVVHFCIIEYFPKLIVKIIQGTEFCANII